MHPALNWEIKSVINFSHFYTLCWTKVERENYISIYVSQYRQLGHIESFFFFIARPGPNCKRHIWLLRIFTLFSNKYSSQEMSLCLLLSFIWQSRLLRNQILFPLISPAGKLSKADSKAKTSSIHPTSHCGEASIDFVSQTSFSFALRDNFTVDVFVPIRLPAAATSIAYCFNTSSRLCVALRSLNFPAEASSMVFNE